MFRGIRFLNWGESSDRRHRKSRASVLGLAPRHRSLVCEPLEDRRLLSVATQLAADAGAMAGNDSAPTTFVVTTAVDVVDANDGLTSLREAISDANNHVGADTIAFALNLAGETITLTGGKFVITDSVTIDGLGAENLAIDANRASKIFEINDGLAGNNINVQIEGLALTGGKASAEDGGAVYSCENLTVRNCTIYANDADDGGGIYVEGGTDSIIVIEDNTIFGNSSLGGGGISANVSANGAVTIQDNIFFGNSSITGGGIEATAADAGYVNIRNNTLFGNDGGSSGGGIHIAISNGTVLVDGCTIYSNSAIGGAGISIDSKFGSGVATIQNSTIFGNSATFYAGGVHCSFFSGGTIVIQNSTIAENTGTSGVGLYSSASISGSLVIRSTIIAGNIGSTDTANPELAVTNSMTMEYSLVGDSTGSGLSEAPVGSPDANGNLIGGSIHGIINPKLNMIDENGGTTKTMALMSDSPAINMGSNPAGLLTDQRGEGYARTVGTQTDMGAYEYVLGAASQAASIDPAGDVSDGAGTVMVTTASDVTDATDGVITLREAISQAASGDTITFAPSLAGKTITLVEGELAITRSVSIIGLGATNLTINAATQSRIFDIDDGIAGSHISVTIQGLTLTGGRAAATKGGAIFSCETLTVSSCVVYGNDAAFGGGIYVADSTSTITDNIFYGNHSLKGGAVQTDFSAYGSALIKNNTIFANHANEGGGISAGSKNGGSTTIQNNTIFGNGALGGAGVSVSISMGTALIEGCTIYANSGNGGTGISVSSSFGTGQATIKNCTVFANHATFAAGGVEVSFFAGGSVAILNSTIANNIGSDKVGLHSSAEINGKETISVESTIIAGNIGSSSTNPEFLVTNPLTMKYCLVGDNTGSGLMEAPLGSPDANGNLIGGAVNGIINPKLKLLADNGGSTETMALMPDSPAVNAGSNSSGLVTDQRGTGFPRTIGQKTDIGAYEYDFSAPTVTINQAAGQADPTVAGPINFTVVFSKTVDDFTAGDVTLSGTVSGTLVATVTGSGTTYNVAVTGMSGTGTVIAMIAAGVAHDSAGNANTHSTSTDNTVAYDGVVPTVTINQASGQADPTNASPINFAVVFSEPVSDFTAIDVTLTKTTSGTLVATVTGSGTTYNVAVTGMTGNGTVSAAIAAGKAHDAAGNANTASASADNTVTYDGVVPTVTINQAAAQADPTAGSPINFTVVFSEAVADFATGDVTLSGTAGATNAVVTGSGTTYNVAVTGMTGSGTVIAMIAANKAHDSVGNANTHSTSTDNSVSYDIAAPTVTIGAPSRTMTANQSVSYAVTYADANFNASTLTAADITLNRTGTADGTVSLSGSGTSYVVTISGISGDGALGISLAAGTASDLAGHLAPAAGPSATFVVDNTYPTVTINQASGQTDPASASPINFTVVFSEAVTDFAAADVTLGGTAGATIATVTGSGTTYNVAVSGMTGGGTVIAGLAAGIAHDAAGNASAASSSDDNSVIYDAGAPTVTIGAPSLAITTSHSVTYTVTYTDVNFNASTLSTLDIVLNRTGTANGTVSLSGSGTSYLVTIDGIAGDGFLGISLAAGTASDLAGNLASAATSTTFIVDNTAPAVTIGAPSRTMTASQSVSYVVTYADANFNASTLSTADIALNKTGTADGTVSVSGSGASCVVTISGITGNGSLGISLAAGTASDLAGHLAPAAGPSATFVVDNISPTVTINQASGQTDPTNASPINFTVVFSEAVTDFAAADVTLGGTAGATIAMVTGSGTTYNVAVSGMTGSGTVTAGLAAGIAHDAAGNASAASTSDDDSVTFDAVAPTVTIGAPSRTMTANDSVSFGVTYADVDFNASTLSISDIVLNKTGTADGTVSVSGSGVSYLVTISGISGNGSLGISLAAGTASDLAGNLASAATSTTFIVDNTAPAVTIGAPSRTMTASESVSYTVTYADAHFNASTLTAVDITLNKTGTANGTVSVSGSDASFVVTISGISGDGSLGISLAAGTASDVAGNLALAAGPSAAFLADNTSPTVTINQAFGQADPTNASPINYTVVFSEAVTDFATGDVTIGGTAGATIATVTGSGTTYNVAVSGMTGNGTIIAEIAAGRAHDAVGNANAASTSTDHEVACDIASPTVSIGPPSRTITAGDSVSYTVTYADAHFNASTLSTADIVLNRTGTAHGTLSVSGSGASRLVTISGITGDGSLGISLGAGTASDLAGNLASSSGPSAAFVVDNTALTVNLTVPKLINTSRPSGVVTVASTDWDVADGRAVYLDVDANNDGSFTGAADLIGYAQGTVSGGQWVFTSPPALPDGRYGLRARASDTAGNEGVSQTATMTISTHPAISNVVVTAKTSADKTTIAWSESDNNGFGRGKTTLTIDGKSARVVKRASGKTAASFSFSGKLAVGAHTYVIAATNAIGETSRYSDTFTVAPTAPIISSVKTKATTSDKNSTISWKVADIDGVGAATLTVDGVTVTSGIKVSGKITSLSYAYAGRLSAGTHTYTIAATDSAGAAATPVSGWFTVKATVPVISSVKVAIGTSATATTITWTVNDIDGIGTSKLAIDGTEVSGVVQSGVSTAATFTYSGVLGAGKHTYVIIACDAAMPAPIAAKSATGSFTVRAALSAAPPTASNARGTVKTDWLIDSAFAASEAIDTDSLDAVFAAY